MKKSVKGKTYDTATAEHLAGYENGPSNDFSYIREDLYRKRTGEFFLACEGGPKSRYGVRRGDEFYYGEKMIVLTEDEAKKWAENRNFSAKEYEQMFGLLSDPLPNFCGLTDKQMDYVCGNADKFYSPEAFAENFVGSNIFAGVENAKSKLKILWRVLKAPFSDLLKMMSLTQTGCAARFCIPLRTVQNWAAGLNNPPSYVRLMMARIIGII